MPKLKNSNATFWVIFKLHIWWMLPYEKLSWTPCICMQLSSNKKSSKMFQFAKKLWKKKWFSTCIIITEERAGIFTFLQFQPQEFTLLQDCMIKMNFSVYTKDDHFNWPLLHIFTFCREIPLQIWWRIDTRV